MKIRVCLTIDNIIVSKTIELPESPLVGDEVVVWGKVGGGVMSVMRLSVKSRSWDSNRKQLDLDCTFDDMPALEELRAEGWE